jgi:cytoskeletal protein RodZ
MKRRAPILKTSGGLVKKRFELPFIALAVLFVTVSLGSFAHAQQSAPDAQQPASQSQPPDTPAPPPTASQPAQTEPGQAPSQSTGQAPSTQSSPAAAPADAGSKEYVGTIVKQGDKYMFQETATGTTYDIDHQDEVKKFDGKKVRVHGTMDTDGKTIHVQ